MSKARIAAQLCKILNGASASASKVKMETQLAWLALDSLESVEASIEIEKATGVYVEPAELQLGGLWKTVQQLADHIIQAKEQASAN